MTGDVDAMLTAAQALVTRLDRPRARALYLAILARDPNDDEATVGLARVDGWDGCYVLAERAYRTVLDRSPGNVDARAGLADILTWTSRWKEAERVLDEGLALAPLSPELLMRRARIAAADGDVRVAGNYLAEAERVSPLDPEVREARERLFVGQARLGQRIGTFPAGYDDVATTDFSAMQRWRRLHFELGATVVSRHGATRETRSGPIKTTLIDGRPSVGAFYHYSTGGWVGGTAAVSVPALALPRVALGLAGFSPLSRVFSIYFSTAYWRYADDRDVIILSPALGVAINDTIDVVLHYWLTTVVVRDATTTADYVHSAGARFGWRTTARLTLGLDYTYGVQLERNPSAVELLELRSHILSAFGRLLITPMFGVDLALSGERRTSPNGPDVFGPAVEAGIFTRW
jgi:tetratricopeptide (TPR) repeat protein